MVHNGIEYGDMQLICEAYDIMKRGLGLSNKEIGDVFAKWNKGVLDSFLIEITRDIMYYNDDDGTALVEKILDKAGQRDLDRIAQTTAEAEEEDEEDDE
ncbi:hypothetical protein NQ176_g6974 [Zarea fungicola]|uniref:Uncharacterized protein n=1 Tax=Zarea fungicola TaxID=93591 RepID=A0ACC1N0E6_9HYPO|nr:hypothetical protein NQ176_g6974 [Lecanicillium fungicola]